jgi:hypothetical protein
LNATEAERRVTRGREIVARQRDVIAKVGEVPQAVALLKVGEVPQAVALLKTFEGLLALYEDILAAYQPAAGLLAESPEEANWRQVFRVMEILREGGYDCDLQQTSH